MARRKLISDNEVFIAVRKLLTEGGDKAVSFASVGQATGLAAPTLVQRFGSREGMVQSAAAAVWAELDALTSAAEAEAPFSAKGAQALLKSLGAAPEIREIALLAFSFRERELREQAALWRGRVEAALALRLGGGDKGRDIAAMLFAAWQGQLLWQVAGDRTFRIKDAVKRLTS